MAAFDFADGPVCAVSDLVVGEQAEEPLHRIDPGCRCGREVLISENQHLRDELPLLAYPLDRAGYGRLCRLLDPRQGRTGRVASVSPGRSAGRSGRSAAYPAARSA
jgi:hypothetical protein